MSEPVIAFAGDDGALGLAAILPVVVGRLTELIHTEKEGTLTINVTRPGWEDGFAPGIQIELKLDTTTYKDHKLAQEWAEKWTAANDDHAAVRSNN